ncbi:MAG: nuclear transport factor 2 family protein [candidate division Zixibacteria bacterium]|nr:nuclear transport factor 2 family protein [candidate division Zixibacteria bacterium]
MDRQNTADLARLYVERSNRHVLDDVFPMFDPEATYRSSQFGLYEGLDQIRDMMTGFFATYPDVHWTVDDYRADSDDSASFEFTMRASHAETEQPVERRGLETITFTEEGLIRHVEVEVAQPG